MNREGARPTESGLGVLTAWSSQPLRVLAFGWSLFVIAAACTSSDAADARPYAEPDPETGIGDLTAYLATQVRSNDLPAMAAAVVDTSGIVALGAAGLRHRGTTDSVEIGDAWHLGSDTKSMHALMVATMVEDSLLSWDTTVGEALGSAVQDMLPAWKQVTISQLLTHRGGAPPNLVNDHAELWARLRSAEGTPREQRLILAEGVTRMPPNGTPGVDYAYSNAGYALSGAMVEAIAGEPWERLMQERIFTPLGLESAGFGAPGPLDGAGVPWGHGAAGGASPPGPESDNPPGIGPAGTIHMSIADWGAYGVEILRLAAGRDGLVRAETFSRLLEVPGGAPYGYAMGWELTDEAGPAVRVASHSGSNTLWYALIWMPLESNYGVMVVTNQGGDGAREAVDAALWNLVLDMIERRRVTADEV